MAKLYYFLALEQFQPETLVRHAQAAEQAGFDGVMASDHFHAWVDDAGASSAVFSTLGAIAQATNNLQLMTAVVTPLWRLHPAMVAQAAATIDRLSNGRFELGLGMGRARDELPLGATYPAYAERNQRMREALTIIRELLGGRQLTFEGRYYQTNSAKLYSPPIRNVPIYLAANAPKSATLAGELSDGIMTTNKTPAEMLDKAINPAKQAAGGSTTVISLRWSVVGANDEQVWQAVQPVRGLRAPERDSQLDPSALRKWADNTPRAEVLKSFPVVPDVASLVDVYSPLIEEVGSDIIGIQVTGVDQLALIKQLGSDLLPELRKRAAQ